MTKVKGTNVEGKLVTLEKCQPKQLSLFGSFLPEDGKYSNTIELYDAIPKYFASSKVAAKRMLAKDRATGQIKGEYLAILERRFTHKGKDYIVKIKPARLKDEQGYEKEYYPTEREELVEEALRKLLCDRLNGVFLDNLAGVQFTLYELQQELKRWGHTINHPDLVQALLINRGTGLTLEASDGTGILDSAILPELLLTSRERWRQDPKQTRCYAQFNRLVTHSIDHLTYRQFDYIKFMGYKRQLTRWFHKRLSHNYLQAQEMTPYHIKLTTVIRDSGLVHATRTSDQKRHIEACLDELQESDVLSAVIPEVRRGRRNRIEEVKYSLYPCSPFVQEVKKANRRDGLLFQEGARIGIQKKQDPEIYQD